MNEINLGAKESTLALLKLKLALNNLTKLGRNLKLLFDNRRGENEIISRSPHLYY